MAIRARGTQALPMSVALTAALSLAAAQAAEPTAAEPVVLATHELCPYGCTGADGRFDGVAVQVVRCALGRLGRPLEVRVYPWARAQQEAHGGAVAGFFGASHSAERDAWAELSAEIAPQQWRWYLRADNPLDPASPAFRTQATVAGYIGANMLEWLEQEGYRVVSRPPDTPALLDSLMARRVDAVLANNLVMDALLAERRLVRDVKSVLAKDKPLGVYFSRKYLGQRPGFLAAFNAAVGQCRQ